MSGASVTAEPPVREAPPSSEPGSWRKYAIAAGFLAPAAFFLGLWIVYPTVKTIIRSFYGRDELDAPALDVAWERRRVEGIAAVRRLVELVRAGRVVLIFPEGRPSLDGALATFQPGLATLVRLGRPRALQPVGVAYDRLTTGRPLAIVSFGSPRSLLLRPRGGGESIRFPLGHGDLIVMGGSCQRTWEHAIPKTARPVGPRVSVQFRPAGVA